ncbi:hypothetical protein [Haloactinospora alba]|uniref:hypothetical protein n=1 Tax=Haloactinospora alba TaxID=405555 RepID=UPI001154009E|nr:hypothetical protein [Haloactinospora alba]
MRKRIFDEQISIRVSCDPEAFVHEASEALKNQGWRIEKLEKYSLSACYGSRFIFRMFGLFFSVGRRNIPAILDVAIKDGDSKTVALRFRSDEGWYVAAHPLAHEIYEKDFRSTVEIVSRNANAST